MLRLSYRACYFVVVLTEYTSLMAHDENNVCKVGDTVEIVESRPLSSRKRWRVRRVVRAAVAAGASRGKTAQESLK